MHDGEEFQPAHPQEESIYTDDPVRVYLREMGAVPLLTREGEVDLARKMERGKLRMQRAISRSPLVQNLVLELAEQVRTGDAEIDDLVELGDVEAGTPADLKRRAEIAQQFADYQQLVKKLQQTYDKHNSIPASNKKLKRRWTGKWNRTRVEVSRAIRLVPFQATRWRDFARALERACEELMHLDAELRRLDNKASANNHLRARELRK